MSFPALFTGKYPTFMGSPRVGVRITLSEFLKASGYTTMAFVASNPYAVYFSGGAARFDIFHEYPPIVLENKKDLHLTKSFISKLLKCLLKDKSKEILKGIDKDVRKILSIIFPPRKLYSRGLIGDLVFMFYDSLLMKLFGIPSVNLGFMTVDGFGLNNLIVNSLKAKFANKGQKAFFVWIHYMSTHFPYDDPNHDYENFIIRSFVCAQKIVNQKEGLIFNRKLLQKYYFEGIKALDGHIKQLFESLDDFDLLEDSIVIFTSDHGEELFEHGNYGHGGYLRKEVLHVPLLIYGLEDSGTIFNPVMHADIFPTILDLVSQHNSPNTLKTKKELIRLLDGQTLLKPQNKIIISESITRSKKIIEKSKNKYPEPDIEYLYRVLRGEHIGISKLLGKTLELNLMAIFLDGNKISTKSITITNPQEVKKILENTPKSDPIRYLAIRAGRILNPKHDLSAATRYSIIRKSFNLKVKKIKT